MRSTLAARRPSYSVFQLPIGWCANVPRTTEQPGVLRGGVKLLERLIEVSGVELCTEAFGDPADPPILLVMGIVAFLLWWEHGFGGMLADGGGFVIRHDHRGNGRSVTYEPALAADPRPAR